MTSYLSSLGRLTLSRGYVLTYNYYRPLSVPKGDGTMEVKHLKLKGRGVIRPSLGDDISNTQITVVERAGITINTTTELFVDNTVNNNLSDRIAFEGRVYKLTHRRNSEHVARSSLYYAIYMETTEAELPLVE